MREPAPVARRRLWPVLVPFVLVVALAILWTGFWFYAASAAETAMAGWREREAKAGRVYTCDQQTVGGYPFRFEVRCADPGLELRREVPPLALKAAGLVAVVQIYQPTLLIAEFKSPMTVAESGMPPGFVANWTAGRASVRGTPRAPERVSMVFDGASLDRQNGGATAAVFKATQVELHGRMAEGSATDNPVIDIVLRLAAASAPELHPLTVQPLDADVAVLLRGLPDFAPKPWPVRLKELQARGGKIEITKARVQQGDVVAVSAGTLGLTARGGLDGQLQVTIVGLDKVLKALDIERMVSEGDLGAKLDSLDRILPGLGRLARKNAAPGIVAGLGALGQGTTLEGKPAVTLPLRFADGQIMLGPIPLGRVPPLF
jgi:hypothetical protein